MSVTQDELDRFHEFASAKIANGGSNLSLRQLVDSWLSSHSSSDERAAVNAVLRRSIQEMNSGLDRPAEEIMQELRAEFELPAT